MAKPRQEIRQGQKHCPACDRWKAIQHFRIQHERRHGSMPTFKKLCKVCEQAERDRVKHVDRALVKLTNSAASHARHWDVTRDELLQDLRWIDLLEWVRACMDQKTKCISCGHDFLSAEDVEIDIRDPLRHRADRARMHVQNVGPLCQTCNQTKGARSWSEWLDYCAEARASLLKEARIAEVYREWLGGGEVQLAMFE